MAIVRENIRLLMQYDGQDIYELVGYAIFRN